MMLGTHDLLTFVLAERLGKTLGEVRALPRREVEEWAAFYRYRELHEELRARPRRG